MRTGFDRCAAILDLIDGCLAEYDATPTVAAPPAGSTPGTDAGALLTVPAAWLDDARLVDA